MNHQNVLSETVFVAQLTSKLTIEPIKNTLLAPIGSEGDLNQS